MARLLPMLLLLATGLAPSAVMAGPSAAPPNKQRAAYMLEVSYDGTTRLVTFADGKEGTITRTNTETKETHKLAVSATDAGSGMIEIDLAEIETDGSRRELGGGRVRLKGMIEVRGAERTISATYVGRK